MVDIHNFLMIIPATTLQDVHLELAKEEALERSMATAMASPQKFTFIGFITTGFDLEDSSMYMCFIEGVKASTDWKVD